MNGATVSADWNDQTAPATSKLDPSLFWGEATGWAGYYSPADGRLRMAVELASSSADLAREQALWFILDAQQAQAGAQIAPHWLKRLAAPTPPRFFTARLPLQDLDTRYGPQCERLKPGLVGNAGGGSVLEDGVSGNLLPSQTDRWLHLLADDDVQAVQVDLLQDLAAQEDLWLRVPAHAQVHPSSPLAPFTLQIQGRDGLPVGTLPPFHLLSGAEQAVALGVIDFGCPFAHPHFMRRGRSGETRVTHFWDQGRQAAAPGESPLLPWQDLGSSFGYGREADTGRLKQLMDETAQRLQQLDLPNDPVLFQRACYALAGLPELIDPACHGSHVLDILAGRGAQVPGPDGEAPPDGGDATGEDPAARADILFVQLPDRAVEDLSGGWLAAFVIDAVEYILTRARATDPDRPVVINLSYGHYGGPHDGHSLLEAALDHYASLPGVAIVLAAGNLPEDGSATHLSGSLGPGEAGEFRWHAPADDPTQSFLELWYRSDDLAGLGLDVTAPSGRRVPRLDRAGCRGGCTPAAPGDLPAASTGFGMLLMPGSRAGGQAAAALAPTDPADAPDLGLASGMALLALAPNRDDGSCSHWPALSEPGYWTVRVVNRSPSATVYLDVWVERNEPGPVQDEAAEQSFLEIDPTTSPLRRDASNTLTGIANGRHTVVVDGSVVPAGPLDGATRRYPESGQGTPRHGPQVGAPAACAAGGFRHGLLAAGNLGGLLVAMEGTSMAAPRVARQLAAELQRGGSGLDLVAAWQRRSAGPRPGGPGRPGPAPTLPGRSPIILPPGAGEAMSAPPDADAVTLTSAPAGP